MRITLKENVDLGTSYFLMYLNRSPVILTNARKLIQSEQQISVGLVVIKLFDVIELVRKTTQLTTLDH